MPSSFFSMRHMCVTGAITALSLLISSCANSPSPLQPQGTNAGIVAPLLWVLMAIGVIVSIIVTALLVYALWRGHKRENLPGDDDPQTDKVDQPPPIQDAEAGLGSSFVLIGGGIIPALILVMTFGGTVWILDRLEPGNEVDLLTVEIIAHQWWWEIRYPEQDFVTANEIHVPVDTPVEFVITSADVIHSFWVPQVHAIIDAIPGDFNRIRFEANEAGVYRGECTEYCGIQHAKMFFFVVAEPETEFVAWLSEQQQVPPEPDEPLEVAGKELFFEKACDSCHRIAGTAAQGELGPDLTHFASRLTIGAGILENNRGNLGGWIVDPQAIKLGSLMPLTDYSGAELQALLAYMETLQ